MQINTKYIKKVLSVMEVPEKSVGISGKVKQSTKEAQQRMIRTGFDLDWIIRAGCIVAQQVHDDLKADLKTNLKTNLTKVV